MSVYAPVLHLRFDEDSGSIAHDSSGNGNDGTLSGSPLPSWVQGKYGNALSVNGGYVSIPASSSLQCPQFTFCCWIKGTAPSSGFVGLINPTDSTYYFLLFSDGSIYAGFSGDTAPQSPPTTIFDGNRHFIVITHHYGGGDNTVNIYFDGTNILSSATTVQLIPAWTGSLYIARPDYPLNGIVDEVQVLPYAASPSEIPFLQYNIPQFGSHRKRRKTQPKQPVAPPIEPLYVVTTDEFLLMQQQKQQRLLDQDFKNKLFDKKMEAQRKGEFMSDASKISYLNKSRRV
jgi:hypothetical protein